jgi:hypothetical protein
MNIFCDSGSLTLLPDAYPLTSIYPPLASNGLKTRPGLPGTALATGNCGAAGAGFAFAPALLFPFVRRVEFESPLAEFRAAMRDGGVGEGSVTGRPGVETSEVVVADVVLDGSESLWCRTYLTGAVTARYELWATLYAVSQPATKIPIRTMARAGFILSLYRRSLFHATYIGNEILDLLLAHRP